MATVNQLRSVHGYTATLIYPIPDGALGVPDLAHIAWLYAMLYIVTATAFNFSRTSVVFETHHSLTFEAEKGVGLESKKSVTII